MVRLWVGQVDNDSSIIPLAILYRHNSVWIYKTSAKILNFLLKAKFESDVFYTLHFPLYVSGSIYRSWLRVFYLTSPQPQGKLNK